MMTHVLTRKQIQTFWETIYGYYRKCGRKDLPWRKTHNSYHMLVSEIMLQQTQVARVSQKYSLFIKQFPTSNSLAHASLRSVLEAWSGLGYNRRALALKRTSELIFSEHRGSVPHGFEELIALPGIGRTTASAILAFAFNEPVIFIETNIRTVFIHFFFKKRRNVHDSEILPLVEQTLDRAHPRSWYYALMDYGAMLKKRANPSRKSAHYKKQGAFKGSRRQARGAIIRALTEKGLTLKEIVEVTKCGRRKTEALLAQLERESLIKRKGERLFIPD